MNLEIHNPELVQRVNAQIQSGHFHDADELLEKALDALEGRTPPSVAPAAERHSAAGQVLTGNVPPPTVPILHLGVIGPLHRRDLYDAAR